MHLEDTILLNAAILGYDKDSTTDKSSVNLQGLKALIRAQVELKKGQIIQDQKDGILAIFESTIDALQAAEIIQRKVPTKNKVPLQISIHQGELELRDGQAFGAGVTEVRELAQIGAAGSVVLSKQVQSKLSSNKRFSTPSLGQFQFKDLEQPVEIFTLKIAEPIDPDIAQQSSSKPSRQRWSRALRLFAGYLVASWTFLQFVDWALTRYQISPYWTDILLWTFVGIIPSLLIYLVHQDRINQRKLLRREKILIPLNLLLLFGGLTFAYGKADLGSITKKIDYTNAEGQAVAGNIVKSEFKKPIGIFLFEQKAGADSSRWLERTLATSIQNDLLQDQYLMPLALLQTEMIEKIKAISLYNAKYFIDGSYQLVDGDFEIKPVVRNAKNGKIIQEKTFKGDDLFILIDSISIYIRQAVGLTPAQMEASIDLDFSNYNTDNFEAFKYFSKGFVNQDWSLFEKSIELDSTFATSMFIYATQLYLLRNNQLEPTLLVEKAMKYRKKLPESTQFLLLVFHYLLQEEYDKAEKLINAQLELHPKDHLNLMMLNMLYQQSGDFGKLKAVAEKLFKDNPNPAFYINAIQTTLREGKAKQVEKDVLTLLEEFPQNIQMLDLLMDVYLLQQKYDQAEETVAKMILMDPDLEPTKSILIEAIQYLKNNPAPKEIMTALIGEYKDDSRERIMTIEERSNCILHTYQANYVYFSYPLSDTAFVRGFSTYINEFHPLFDENGVAYGLLLKQENLDGRKGEYYYWKQDSLIRQAEELLKNRNYEEALPAYEAAIARNPEHYYLYKGKEHVEYMLSKTEEEIEQLYLRYVGDYGEGRQIGIADGLLYYDGPQFARIIFRPISDTEFVELSDYNGIYVFEKETGKDEIKGMYAYVYDKKLKQWQRVEGWYRARVKMKD